MGNEVVVKTACGHCNAACGVLVHMKNGTPVKIEGDKDDPNSMGALCAKGLTSIEFLTHPDRLKYPLKRAGKRGEGKWERISWEEAIGAIASKMIESKSKYGPLSVIFAAGAYKGGVIEGLVVRIAAAFGTPNIVRTSSICHFPRIMAANLTYGFNAVPDFDCPPACLVIWGANRQETNAAINKHTNEATSKGAKLIVIDPRETEFAKRADIWLRLRPNTDLALALGFMHVMINEGLYDKDFVENWAVGFDKLKSHVQKYTPEKVQETTWVSADTIRAAARMYANSKPACISWGNGLDHNINNFQSGRALASLRALSGNLARPGGDIFRKPSGALVLQNEAPSYIKELLPEDVRRNSLSAIDRLLPVFPYCTPQSLVRAILEEKPYPIHTLFVTGAGLLHTYSHANETYQALNKMDFWAIADLFITPTAALADIVLPAATYLEQDCVYEPDLTAASRPQIQRKVAQVGEAWPDHKIMIELAKRLGVGDKYWKDEKDLLDSIVRPSGITFEEAKQKGLRVGGIGYGFYESAGFTTPSKKVELFSERLESWGFEPLPDFHEPLESPYSAPELAKEYPLIMTSWKSSFFQHSQGKQISGLRRYRPEPLVEIHPETAKKLGIKNGDWVFIETKRGRIKQKACFAKNIDPRVVFVDYGWWFPEKGVSEFYGWADSNLNVLTDNKKPFAREMGSATLRGILCKVYKETS